MMYNKKKSTFKKKYPVGRSPRVNLLTGDWSGSEENVSGTYH